jgi:hypothetical protein
MQSCREQETAVEHQITAEQGLLSPWRQILVERAQQAVDALASVPGVLGLILCGSVGREEAWPLSDIDVIPLYEDGWAERAASEVEARRHELLDWWTDEGYCASLDVGKLAFARSEVVQALTFPPSQATRYLDDARWFHSLDKGHRGRAAFDPEGLATALSRWLTEARFAPDVVRGRLATHWQQTLARYEQAAQALDEGNSLAAAIALGESLHVLMRYLMESWGGRDNSFARFGTRFERTAIERGERELADDVMALYDLVPEAVARRMAVAPHGIRYRHRLSLQARRLVGEPVTADQDARDVLLVFSTMMIRRGQPPFAEWVGLETDHTTLTGRLDQYRRLLERARVRHGLSGPRSMA